MDELSDLLARQAGVFSRTQAHALGFSDAAIGCRIAAGKWQRVHRGVYATTTGLLSVEARRWAALLAGGPGAVLSHHTAAAIHGLSADHEVVHITVPGQRRVGPLAGVVVHRSRAVHRKTHKARQPPCTTVEETALDLISLSGRVEELIGILSDVCRLRLSTPARLRAAALQRTNLPHRCLVLDVLADVAAGAHSVLERRYLRDVERAHRLPVGHRQRLVALLDSREWTDVAYDEFRLLVELDGRRGHDTADDRLRDMRRDNRRQLAGEITLRYGWEDVAGRPCAVAAQVAQALQRAGWKGSPSRCGKSCQLVVGPAAAQVLERDAGA